jgi:hypothetical protein
VGGMGGVLITIGVSNWFLLFCFLLVSCFLSIQFWGHSLVLFLMILTLSSTVGY